MQTVTFPFCAIKFSDFSEKLFLPVVKPDRFTPNIDETEMSVEFHYSAPQNDFLCSDEGWGCSDYELKNGIAYYDTKKMYSGTISDFYNFTEFPFDKQILRVALIPDHVANHFMQVDLIQGLRVTTSSKQTSQIFKMSLPPAMSGL